MRARIENLRFAEGSRGDSPPGWYLGQKFMPGHVSGYEACNGGQRCANVRSVRPEYNSPVAFLYQIVDATPYRGKKLTFRAAVRTDGAPGSVARLLVRVHRNDCSTSFRDDMGNHPISATKWSYYEIPAPIALDARDIEFGMQVVGPGQAWIDSISMDFADTAH